MNLGINCYCGTDIYKFRRMLASMFVKPLIKISEEDHLNLIKMFNFCEKKTKNIIDFLDLIHIIIHKKEFNYGTIYIKTEINNETNQIKILIIRYISKKQFIFNKSILILFKCFDYHRQPITNNIIENRKLLKKLCYIYIYINYININNQKNTINEYIEDLIKYNMVKKKYINEDIKIIFIIDGISGKMYENYKDYLNRGDLFEINYYKENLEKHFNEINDKTENLNLVIKTIEEFKLLYNNVEIIGSKYSNNCTINRNIFMSNYNDKPIMFIDDDDISCSLYERYKLYNKIMSNYKYIPNKECIKKINDLTGLNMEINNRKNRYEFVKNVFLKIKKDKIFNIEIIDLLKEIINETEIFVYTKNYHDNCFENFYKKQYIKYGPFCGCLILPYIIKPFSTIYQVFSEDNLFGILNKCKNISDIINEKYHSILSYYFQPSNDSIKYNKQKQLTSVILYPEMSEININPFFDYENINKNNKTLNRVYNYNTKILYIFNNQERLEPILKHF